MVHAHTFCRLIPVLSIILSSSMFFNSHAESKISFNTGIGIIGDGDLIVNAIGFGSKHTLFNCIAILPGVSTCFGNSVRDVNKEYGFNLPYQINRYDNYYAIQGDMSIGLFKKISFFTPMVFGGITPTYESQIGSNMYISSSGSGTLNEIDIWYGMDRGFSWAINYGVSFAFTVYRIDATIKGIQRFDDDNIWTFALLEIGLKLPEFHK